VNQRIASLAIGSRARTAIACSILRAKNALSMRSVSLKLHARKRICEAGLYDAQARKRPSLA